MVLGIAKPIPSDPPVREKIAVHIDQRATRVARVDRRIRLDKILIIGNADIPPPQRTDDAERHTGIQPEWTADGKDEISHLQLLIIRPF